MRGDGAVEDVDEDWPPKDERGVGDDDGFDFPLQGGSSPGGIAPPEGKSAPAQVPPRDGGVPSRKSSIIFSRSKDLKYQKMGTGGGPCWAQPTRARLGGLARPSVLWSPGGLPFDSYSLQYFLYIPK